MKPWLRPHWRRRRGIGRIALRQNTGILYRWKAVIKPALLKATNRYAAATDAAELCHALNMEIAGLAIRSNDFENIEMQLMSEEGESSPSRLSLGQFFPFLPTLFLALIFYNYLAPKLNMCQPWSLLQNMKNDLVCWSLFHHKVSAQKFSSPSMSHKLCLVELAVKYVHPPYRVSTWRPVNSPQRPLWIWACNLSSGGICIKAPYFCPPVHLFESNSQNETLDFVSCRGRAEPRGNSLIYTSAFILAVALSSSHVVLVK